MAAVKEHNTTFYKWVQPWKTLANSKSIPVWTIMIYNSKKWTLVARVSEAKKYIQELGGILSNFSFFKFALDN